LRCGVMISCAAFVCLGGSAQRGAGKSHPPGYAPSRMPKSEEKRYKR
jgi:hypothetical protein